MLHNYTQENIDKVNICGNASFVGLPCGTVKIFSISFLEQLSEWIISYFFRVYSYYSFSVNPHDRTRMTSANPTNQKVFSSAL